MFLVLKFVYAKKQQHSKYLFLFTRQLKNNKQKLTKSEEQHCTKLLGWQGKRDICHVYKWKKNLISISNRTGLHIKHNMLHDRLAISQASVRNSPHFYQNISIISKKPSFTQKKKKKENQYFFKQQYIHGIKWGGQGRASYISSVHYAFTNLHLYFIVARIMVTVMVRKFLFHTLKKDYWRKTKF